jgi:hypothetical protein
MIVVSSYHSEGSVLDRRQAQTLPNLDHAVVPLEKLRDYVLNTNHPDGRHKAAVFKSALGIEAEHAGILAEIIRGTLFRARAQEGLKDQFGDRWATYHEIVGLTGRAAIVTAAWIFKKEKADTPVLVSCYIEVEAQERLSELLASEQQE